MIAVLQPASQYVFKALRLVMILAPLGAFGGMAYTIGKYGVHTLLPLGKLMICVYLTCIFFIFIVLGLLMRYYKISLWKFLKYIREELLIVLGTSSSEAALPSLMIKLERMGCSKSITGLVVPAGYSFNLDGTTIYLSMAVLFLAQVYHIQLTGGTNIYHYWSADDHFERCSRRNRQRVCGIGINFNGSKSDTGRRPGTVAGCGSLYVRSEGPYEFYWEWSCNCLACE